MAEQLHVQHLRGTTAKNDAYTGLAGELTVNTDSKSLRIHDGVTQGGFGTVYARSYTAATLPEKAPKDMPEGAIAIVED